MSRFALPRTRAPLFCVGVALCLWSCAPDTSPTVSDEVRSAETIPASEFTPVAFGGVEPEVSGKAAGTGSVQELISAEQGGQVLLDWEIKDQDGVTGSKVKVEVKILPGALTEDTIVSIALENPAYAMLAVDLEFAAHGTRFLVPAEVKLDLEGLDLLSEYDSEDEIDLYWYDPAADSWHPVPCDYKVVELDQGKAQGIWYFDHFSRYGLGGGRRRR